MQSTAKNPRAKYKNFNDKTVPSSVGHLLFDFFVDMRIVEDTEKGRNKFVNQGTAGRIGRCKLSKQVVFNQETGFQWSLQVKGEIDPWHQSYMEGTLKELSDLLSSDIWLNEMNDKLHEWRVQLNAFMSSDVAALESILRPLRLLDTADYNEVVVRHRANRLESLEPDPCDD